LSFDRPVFDDTTWTLAELKVLRLTHITGIQGRTENVLAQLRAPSLETLELAAVADITINEGAALVFVARSGCHVHTLTLGTGNPRILQAFGDLERLTIQASYFTHDMIRSLTVSDDSDAEPILPKLRRLQVVPGTELNSGAQDKPIDEESFLVMLRSRLVNSFGGGASAVIQRLEYLELTLDVPLGKETREELERLSCLGLEVVIDGAHLSP
jgi:hypothetical protein